ncbi:hypothetical protein AM1_E0110 (plasmid) [Acaryochloris marina MBIC11017]|uniref:Uncharacterized protein n=1 Tax=Acaryochloris marina (strain MBIC 11017) TaxID=329726 RepID=A8ZPE3_ACAM1|nr:hypothetical protein AM1_E0110 [Acaryochloris marina MBIC11017]
MPSMEIVLQITEQLFRVNIRYGPNILCWRELFEAQWHPQTTILKIK